MPPRPALKVMQNRPMSAIYLGKDANSHALQSTPSSSSHTEATFPGLPDLPEPPSPSSSIRSVQSGLPSPPATNSTGSGSTGDPATIAFRERSLSHQSNSSNSTSSGTASTPMKRSLNESETGAEYDDYDNENGNDNDNDDDTARLNENVMALQRLKSLAERNRMAISKLSRMSSASPHRPSPPRSGSETEREINSPSSSSHHPSPSLSSVSLSHDPSHQRRTSALTSESASSSNSSHSRCRNRASMASMSSLQLTDFDEEVDNDGLKTATGTARTRTRKRTLSERDLITQSALAAVASSRRSPLSSRRRAALPKEFRSDLADDSPSPAGPNPGRISVAGTRRGTVDPDIRETSWKQPVDPVTPFRSTRPSTIRDYRRSGEPKARWSVDDFRSPSTVRDRQYNTSHSNEDGRGRERDSIPLDRAGSSFTRYIHNSHAHTPSPVPLLSTPQRTQERLSTPSPFGIRRLNAQTPGGGSSSNQTEHIKLMLESMTMLETQLNKIPPGKFVGGSRTGTGVSTGALQTELVKNAQSMVYAAERLSGLLKQGSGRAVEEQVEVEVEGSSTGPDAQEISNIWSRVAAEYRENSRVADELVRGMTGFLLGIGRVMRDIGPSSLADYAGGGGSPSAHGKNASLDADEEGLRLRREGASPDVGSAGSGRRSALSRNSWEPRERDKMVASSGSGSAGASGQRPESVLARASPTTYQKLRSGDRELQFETPPSQQQRHIRQASIRKSLPAPADRTEAARKLFTPRQQREQMLDAKFSSGRPVDGSGSVMPTRDSQETVQPLNHEPSPTPVSRTRGGNTQERERMLPPLNIPRPLPTLPSEILVRRQTINNHVERIAEPTPATTAIGRDRRSTVRSSLPTSLTTPSNATTAVTPHTVSNSSSHSNCSTHTNSSGSGSASAFPLHRSDSSRSHHSQVTFSRPLESASVSVSAALTGLQQYSSVAKESSAGERERNRERDREGDERREWEREKRRTIGNMRSARMCLDGQTTRDDAPFSATGGTGTVDFGSNVGAGASSTSGVNGGSRRLWDTHAADRSAASTFSQHPGPVNRREQRRTVTDIWPD